MALNDAVLALMDVVQGVAGIRQAPDYPPDTAGAFPFAVAYLSGGTYTNWTHARPLKQFEGNITLQLHVARRDLPRAVEEVMVFPDRIRNAIAADRTLNGKLQGAISTLTVSGLQGFSWGGVDTLGFEFTIPVLIQEN